MIFFNKSKIKMIDYAVFRSGVVFLSVIFVVFGLSISCQSIFAAPTIYPVADNASQVIHIGSEKQVKLGPLFIRGNFGVNSTAAPALYVDNTNNFIGSGTNTPDSAFNIYDNVDNSIISLNGVTTNYRGLKITDVNNIEKWFSGANSSDFVIRSNLTNNFTIDPAGKIGFGIAVNSTSSKVTTAGDVDVSGVYKINGATSTFNQWSTTTNGQYYQAGGVSIGTSSSDTTSSLRIYSSLTEGLRLVSATSASPFVIYSSAGVKLWEIGVDGKLLVGNVPWPRIVGEIVSPEKDPTIGEVSDGYILKMGISSSTITDIRDNGSSVGMGMAPSSQFKLIISGDMFSADGVMSRGISWKLATSSNYGSWRVSYGNGLFVAVDGSGTNHAMSSPDGINWTPRTTASGNYWTSIVYGNGLFVTVAKSGSGNRVMTSSDGANWTLEKTPIDRDWQSVTYGNGLFVAVASGGVESGQVMTSPDGINWTSRISAVANDWMSVTYGGSGIFVAVARSGSNDRIMTSDDGINWVTRANDGVNNNWKSVTYGVGLFVAVADSGVGNRIITSSDGLNWTWRSSPLNNNWNSVTYGGGLFVAISSSGTGKRVMTSKNGIDWVARKSAADDDWQSIVYGNGRFVAVAEDGGYRRVMYSGLTESNIVPSNNVYQGGMSIFGHLGLGTSEPNGNLHVYETISKNAGINIQSVAGVNKHWAIYNASTTNDLLFWNNTPTGEKNIMTVRDEGNIGITDTNPSTKLSLYDSSTGPIISLMGLNSNYRGLKITDLSNSEKWFVGTNGSNDFIASHNGGLADLTVSSSTGYIGLGVGNPIQRLDVGGNIKADKIKAGAYCDANGANCRQYDAIDSKNLVCHQYNQSDADNDGKEVLNCGVGESMVGGSCKWHLGGNPGEKIYSHPSGDNGWYCEHASDPSGGLSNIFVQCCVIQ